MHELIFYLVLFPQEICLMELIFFEETQEFFTKKGTWVITYVFCPPGWGWGSMNQVRNSCSRGPSYRAGHFSLDIIELCTSFALYFMVCFPCRYSWNVELNNSWFPNYWFRYSCHFLSWLYFLQGDVWGSSYADL